MRLMLTMVVGLAACEPVPEAGEEARPECAAAWSFVAANGGSLTQQASVYAWDTLEPSPSFVSCADAYVSQSAGVGRIDVVVSLPRASASPVLAVFDCDVLLAADGISATGCTFHRGWPVAAWSDWPVR